MAERPWRAQLTEAWALTGLSKNGGEPALAASFG